MLTGVRDNRGLSFPLVAILMLFIALSACLIMGSSDSAYADANSGWVDQTPFPDGEYLFEIDAADTETAWAVGNNGAILKTEDGGVSWEVQNSAEGQNLKDVCAVDSSVAWAVGYAGPDAVVLSTDDGGDTWVSHDAVVDMFRVVPGGEYINNVFAYGVTAIDAETAWVTADYYASVPNPFYPPFYIQSVFASSIWKTVDGGDSWTMQYFSLVPESLYKIYALDASTVWTAGGNFTAGSYALKSVDGGATWTTQFPQAPFQIRNFSVADSNIAWGSVYTKTVDGGTTWMPMDPELPYSTPDFAAVDADVAWTLGQVGVSQGKQGLIAKTTDGGQTYVTQYSGTEHYLQGICALDESTAWVVGEHGTILKTTNGGWGTPAVTGIQPTVADIGETVTLSGVGFGESPGTSYVTFGEVQATAYTSWTDTQIEVEVPAGVSGPVAVTVTTPDGTSHPYDFTVAASVSVTSITPTETSQFALTVDITVDGSGFVPGAQVRLEKGAVSIAATNVNVVSESQAICSFGIFGAEPGVYDVVVENPDSGEARLEEAFTVISACGTGSGSALLLLGLTLGLLSLAGSMSLRKRRKA